MIYEIRNYHYEPTLMAEYSAWARDRAVPYIRSQMDVVGFWVVSGEPAEVIGPPLDDLGSATVTWVIRWPDRETRQATMDRVFASDEWREIMTTNPGREHYHRIEVRFAEAI